MTFVWIKISTKQKGFSFPLSGLPCAAFTPRPTQPFSVLQVALLDQEPLAGWWRPPRTDSRIPNPALKWQ